MLRVRFPTFALPGLLAVAVSACSESADPPVSTGCGAQTSSATTGETEAFGVPLTPAVYLINFLFLYTADPDVAANMPAYMAPLPEALATCLRQNPAGCPWEEYDQYFGVNATSTAGQAPEHCECEWSSECQLPNYQELSARRFEVPAQINQPLGMARAVEMASRLGVQEDMMLSEEEYQCVIGTAPRTNDQEIIFECIADLTNSTGNADLPLSSYGLNVSNGLVRSNCAPDAPCLEFNDLLAGPLEKIMAECGAEKKFAAMVALTPFLEFGVLGNKCQSDSKPACIVDAPCSAVSH